MKAFFKKNWLRVLGILVGALSGYLYYFYVGCSSGSCPITSNSSLMIIVGAIMGFLLFDMFNNNPKQNK